MRRLAALLSLTAMLVLAGCGPGDPETLYSNLGCPRCHGLHREGDLSGPSLKALADTWDSASSLVSYLHDPQSVVDHHRRLKNQGTDYKLKMLPVSGISDEQLHILADWLLTAQ